MLARLHLTSFILIVVPIFVFCLTLQYLEAWDWTFPAWTSAFVGPKPYIVSPTDYQRLLEELEAARLLNASPPTTITVTAHAAVSTPSATAATTSQRDGFAYVFYATSDIYACSALVNIHRLHHTLNVTYPVHVLASTDVSPPYIKAFRSYNTTVHIEQAPPLAPENGMMGGYYRDCLLKLVAFKLHMLDPSLKRVLAFDSDQLVLKNMDHLFTGLPEADLAAPRAYWLAKDFFASTFMMIDLSDRLWHTVKKALDSVSYNMFDMDLINDLLGDTVMMLSGEYVTLNSHWEDWSLPKWYHAQSQLNMTVIEMLNKLSKEASMLGNRQVEPPSDPYSTTAMPIPSVASQLPAHTLTMIPPKTIAQPAAGMPSQAQELAPPVAPAMSPGEASSPEIPHAPRFPPTHPLTMELYRLQDAAPIIHFTAVGKPWQNTAATLYARRPDAHPALVEQVELWRRTAEAVCPGGIPGGWN